MQLALNKATNDLYKPTGGGVTRVDRGRFIVQQVQSKLRTLLGEYLLDSRIGWISMSDFKKNYQAYELEDRARVIILNTQGVLSITSLSSDYSNRVFTVIFSALTIYGEINLEVPWDNANKQIDITTPSVLNSKVK